MRPGRLAIDAPCSFILSPLVIRAAFLPLSCVCCSGPVPAGTGWPLCPDCHRRSLEEASRFGPNACLSCSVPLSRSITTCERCRREAFAFRSLTATGPYRGIRAKVIREFKFGRRVSLAKYIASQLRLPPCDPATALLVPAPSTRRTRLRRGFAGAELICRALASERTMRWRNLLVSAARGQQKGLGYEARANAANGFRVRRRAVPLRHVILVDDVATTGKTADGCARALLQAGAELVDVVVFAIEY